MTPDGDAGPDRTVDARVIRTRNDILSTALRLLVENGAEATTHAQLAHAAGYSRATVYKHWPTRVDLWRDAFTRLRRLPHHTPSGDVRRDLRAELAMFSTGMDRGLDRILAALAEITTASPEMQQVRDEVVTDGEHVVREVLSSVLQGPELEAVTLMLCGSVLYSALLHGAPPDDDVLTASIELALLGAAAGTDRHDGDDSGV